MAIRVKEALDREGKVVADMVDIEHMLLGDLEEKVAAADGILVGSPTINQNTLLPVYKLFSVINPIRDKGKPAAAFGSFGWSGEAVSLIEKHLRNLKLNVISDGITARFYPDDEDSSHLEELAGSFSRILGDENA
jgi:flavorubredoxin